MEKTNELNFPGKLVAIGKVRAGLYADKLRRKELFDEFESRNKEFFESIRIQETELADLEAGLREDALGEFSETGVKNMYGGVKIKMFPVLEYNDKEAFRWAVEHKIALALDKRAFTKIAKTTPMEFVTITSEPKVMIPTKIEVGD